MRRLRVIVGLALFVFLASNASAGPIDISVIGDPDKLIYELNLGDSDAAESGFLFSYLGLDPTVYRYEKVDINGQNLYSEVIGGVNLWAIDFLSFGLVNPSYFMIKVGNAVYDHYLFENVDSMRYGVVNLGLIPAVHGKVTISSISHTSAVATPEPASLSLLVLSLTGIGAAAWRKRRVGTRS